MKPEIKAKWVAALRSDEYAQGQTYLNSASGMCCLGVLCDLHAKEFDKTWTPSLQVKDGPKEYFGNSATAPKEVRDWAGFSDVNSDTGIYTDKITGRYTSLAADNDSGKTFAEIADIIDVHF